MTWRWTFLLLPALGFTIAGCDQPPPPQTAAVPAAASAATPGNVGILDVQKLFVLLGLQQQRVEKEGERSRKLNRLHEEQRAIIDKKLKEFGGDQKELTGPQKEELQQLEAQRVRLLQELNSELQQELAQFNNYLNNVFSQKTREPIRKVAEQRKLEIVLIRHPNLLAYARPGVDITDDVLQEIGPLPPLATGGDGPAAGADDRTGPASTDAVVPAESGGGAAPPGTDPTAGDLPAGDLPGRDKKDG